MKLSPWVRPQASEFTPSDTTSLVRYPEPLDGRVWDLDGSPRWISMVSSCCGPTADEPDRAFHYDWTVDKTIHGGKRDVIGSTVRTSFADAQRDADAYMLGLGWVI